MYHMLQPCDETIVDNPSNNTLTNKQKYTAEKPSSQQDDTALTQIENGIRSLVNTLPAQTYSHRPEVNICLHYQSPIGLQNFDTNPGLASNSIEFDTNPSKCTTSNNETEALDCKASSSCASDTVADNNTTVTSNEDYAVVANEKDAGKNNVRLHIQKKYQELINPIDNEKIKQLSQQLQHSFHQSQQFTYIPTSVDGIYSLDYNIMKIHNIIKAHFHRRYKSIMILQEKVNKYKDKIRIARIRLEQIKYLQKIKKLQAEMDYIKAGAELNSYLSQALPYLAAYSKLGRKVVVKRFGSKTVQQDLTLTDHLRLCIIDDYINVARRFYDINVYRVTDNEDNCCPICQRNLDDLDADETSVCECGYAPTIITKEYSNSLIGNINNNTQRDYQSLVNYMKAFTRFQGKQIIQLPNTLFTDLDVFFQKCKLPIGRVVQTMQLDKRGRRGQTTMKMLNHALEKTGYNDLYPEGYLIAKEYWGWELEDLTYMEADLIRDYIYSQQIYYEVKGDRKSAMNVFFHLHKATQLIQWRMIQKNLRVNYIYKITDFRVVETPYILKAHEEIWKKMCLRINDPVNWPFIPSI